MIAVREINQVALLDLPGIIEADKIKERLSGLIQGGHRQFAINLSSINFVDSMGLGALVTIFRYSEEQRLDLVFYEAKAYLLKMLGVTRLDKVLKIYPNESEALQTLAGTAT